MSLSGIIHHSHSFTRLKTYHHIYFKIYAVIKMAYGQASIPIVYIPRNIPQRILGPLHISPVDRAGSVSKISPRRSFLYKNFNVFI